MDLDGWDATVKACLLANVLMDGRVRPERVPRQGVSSLAPEAVRDALMEGKRLKQIARGWRRSEEHTSELQSQSNLVCRLLLEKKKKERMNRTDTRNNTNSLRMNRSEL